MTWIFNTAIGRFALVLAIVLLCWWGFSSYYRNEGKRECFAEIAAQQAARDADSRKVAKAADKEVAAIQKAAGEARVEVIEKIRTVYRDPPRTQPVAPGSCVHPVDPEVQAELEARWRAANGGAP